MDDFYSSNDGKCSSRSRDSNLIDTMLLTCVLVHDIGIRILFGTMRSTAAAVACPWTFSRSARIPDRGRKLWDQK
jgi:hypothetical protein